MNGLNKVILIGRVGKDPDTYQFEDGTKKMNFPLATTESYRDKNTDEWKDITEWHNIVGYRYLAERNIAKGDLIYVEGKIKSRKYTDKDGVEKYVTEILAEKLNKLSRYQQNETGTARSVNTDSNNVSGENPAEITSGDTVEDDLPF